jgi:hypothetical protein
MMKLPTMIAETSAFFAAWFMSRSSPYELSFVNAVDPMRPQLH